MWSPVYRYHSYLLVSIKVCSLRLGAVAFCIIEMIRLPHQRLEQLADNLQRLHKEAKELAASSAFDGLVYEYSTVYCNVYY